MKPAPRPRKRVVLDVGKVRALYNAGWNVAKIADEMQVSDKTIYKYLKKIKEKMKDGSDNSGLQGF